MTTREFGTLKWQGFATLILAAMGISGCANLTTTEERVDGDVPGKPRVGNYYFLPRARIALEGTFEKVGDKVLYKVTLTKTNEGDHRYRYFLHQNTNIFYDDHTTLEVDDQGLLTTVNVQSEDKTPAIIDKVTETLVSLAKISANLGGLPGEPPAKEVDPEPFKCVFDPFDSSEVAEARKTVSRAKMELTVDTHGIVRPDKVAVEPQHDLSSSGVYYRPPTVVTVQLKPQISTHAFVTQKATVRVPDPRHIAVLKTTRPFLTSKTVNATFAGGDLKKLEYVKPSTALAVVSIPASVTAKVADAIPTIIQVRDARANAGLSAEKAKLDAQKGVLDSQLGLLKARKDLETAQTPVTAIPKPSQLPAEPPQSEAAKKIRQMDEENQIRRLEVEKRKLKLELGE